jgi:hypothetical protein
VARLHRASTRVGRGGAPALGSLAPRVQGRSQSRCQAFLHLDKDEVKFWEYVEGLHKHSVQSLWMVMETLVQHMSGAFEVGYVYFGALFSSTPSLVFPWF